MTLAALTPAVPSAPPKLKITKAITTALPTLDIATYWII
jgi:hypothetical protein